MDVALLGASGDCGRQIAAQLIASRLLAPTERLQLVGRPDGPSARVLHGFVSDLTDAHAEYVPELDVVLSPDDIVADIWIVSAGRTPGVLGDGRPFTRAEMGAGNARVFREYASALARHGQGNEIVVVVSNPVELGVRIFAEAIGRERVIGIGAYSDTQRFRREIAADLGMRRQRVTGFMIGEHGEDQLPVWSSVDVHGLDESELAAAITRMRQGCDLPRFFELVASERTAMAGLLAEGRVQEAFARLAKLPPDVRVILKPTITHLSGAKTAMATADVTVELVATLLDGRDIMVAGQVQLEGDFLGLHGPLGVPVIVGPAGIRRVVEIPLANDELICIREINTRINSRIAAWMEGLA